ncbi:MAG TPA: peptidoglycan-binding protein [Geminicoccaceae bacterium]|nr:peptidoglycan-binding protein [Geminicoccaceae bacterium]
MAVPVLRLYDGFADTSPQLRDEVRELQARLRRTDRDIVVDGLFGPGTEQAVRDLQLSRGLRADGVVDLETWSALLDARFPASSDDLATSYRLDDPELSEELIAAARYGALIETAAAEAGLLPAVLAGLGSRQSRWGLALNPRGPAGTLDLAPRPFVRPWRAAPLPPDGQGFGRGLLRLDYDAHAFARQGDWRDAAANVREGCRILGEARALLRRRSVLHGRGLLRGALAAYNCGTGNVLHAIQQGLDIDFYTSGRNYSRDVLSRAGFFQAHGWD